MLTLSPDGSGIPSRFFYEMEYSGQQDPYNQKSLVLLLLIYLIIAPKATLNSSISASPIGHKGPTEAAITNELALNSATSK